MKAPITAAQAMRHPTVVETINTLAQLADKLRVERDALLDRVEKAEKDARRYQVLRNPPYSDNWGDVYAMTFQRTGDMPLKEEELDAAVDRLIYAAMEASK